MNQKIINELRKEKFDKHYQVAGGYINNINKKDIKVLDIGCADEHLKAFLKDDINYYGLDFDGKHSFSVDLDQGNKIPVEDNFFDVVVCLETLEHVSYPKIIMEEIIRVGKKGFIFIGSMPNEYNIYSRLQFLLAIVPKTRSPFIVVEEHQHISLPRVNDIINLFSDYVDILSIKYIWHSRKFKIIDWLMNFLAPIYPNLFSRIVLVIGRGKR